MSSNLMPVAAAGPVLCAALRPDERSNDCAAPPSAEARYASRSGTARSRRSSSKASSSGVSRRWCTNSWCTLKRCPSGSVPVNLAKPRVGGVHGDCPLSDHLLVRPDTVGYMDGRRTVSFGTEEGCDLSRSATRACSSPCVRFTAAALDLNGAVSYSHSCPFLTHREQMGRWPSHYHIAHEF
jgi:hypothetical protein